MGSGDLHLIGRFAAAQIVGERSFVFHGRHLVIPFTLIAYRQYPSGHWGILTSNILALYMVLALFGYGCLNTLPGIGGF